MNPKKRGATHIPHFVEFERWGMEANILLEVYPKRLRDVIGHRDIMEKTGGEIIKNLLLGMMELRKLQLVLRNIAPSSIALSEDLKQLQFCSLDNVARNCREEYQPQRGELPYCCNDILLMHLNIPSASVLRDYWSIAIIILDILFGTEVVIPLFNHRQIVDLLDAIEDYVDPPTHRILKGLLVDDVEIDVEGYVQFELMQKPNMIAKNVRALNVALEDDGQLQDLAAQFKRIQELSSEELKERHDIIRESVRRSNETDSDSDDQEGK